ncbi:MAG: S8 family serine peptidase [Sneathiellales bacterium]|nr:S8 family serine peptidase [Sneathiellales bacterium]
MFALSAKLTLTSVVLGTLVHASTAWAASSDNPRENHRPTTIEEKKRLGEGASDRPRPTAGSSSPTAGSASPSASPPRPSADPSRPSADPSRPSVDPARGTPGAAPSNGRKPGRAVYYGLSSQCLEENQRVFLKGRGFGEKLKPRFSLEFKGGGKSLKLNPTFWSDREISVKLPPTLKLKSGASYTLELKERGVPLAGGGNRKRYSTCAVRQAELPDQLSDQDVVERELLLLLPKQFFNLSQVNSVRQSLSDDGYVILRDSDLAAIGFHFLRVRIPVGNLMRDSLQDLRNTYPQAVIDFNHVNSLASSPRTYARELVSLPSGHQRCSYLANQSVNVGILDGGVDLQHPALASDKKISIAGFGHGTSGLPKASDHGTALSVLYKGNMPEKGYKGLLPSARLFVADILTQKSGKPFAATSSFLEGLNWLAGRKVAFINMSLEGPQNRLMNKALDSAADKGIYLFAAAGNGGEKAPPPYPAAHPDVIAVTAVDREKSLYRKATRGAHVDFSAPGVMLWLAKKGGKGSYRSGTSFAVPFVLAKAVSTVVSENKKIARIPANDLRSMLAVNSLDLGKPGRDPEYGTGMVQFGKC